MATNEAQKPALIEQGEQASLPAHLTPVEISVRAKYFGAGLLPTTALFTYMTGGQVGESTILGVIVGVTLAYFAPEIHQTFAPGRQIAGQVWDSLNRNSSGRAKHRLLDKEWWLTGETSIPYAEPEEEENQAGPEEIEPHKQEAKPDDAEVTAIPPQFVLGPQALAAVKEINEKRFVYFGRAATRQMALPLDDIYHVLDVAKSGRGKSNRFRHAMMQVVGLADTYYLNPFAAPVKSVTDERKIEVWQPIYDRLAHKHPVRDRDEMLQVLKDLVSEIETRSDQEQCRDFSWRAHPIFVFIDEVPEIRARCPEAIDWLDRIGRGGRQFGIFAWIASQSALVQDIGLSTASQAQFKTLIYGGGDKTSANRVMGSVSAEQEKALKTNGAGLTLMSADGLDDTEYVRAPLITNEALFSYFGLPPFHIEEWLAPAKGNPSIQPLRTNLFPFPLFPPEKGASQAQNAFPAEGEKGKGKSGKRVKAPNEDAILAAMDELEEEGKDLTLNAIAKKAGLTRHQYDDIETVAVECGYELDRGKGRPKSADSEREA